MKREEEEGSVLLNHSLNKLKEHNKFLDKFSCSKVKLVQLSIASIVGLGTGLAMMPIFDSEVEKIDDAGLNIDGNNIASAVVTINTLLLFSTVATIALYHHMKDRSNDSGVSDLQKVALDIGKVSSICAAILPISQLWAVEVANQDYTGSTGFDQYLAWATFTTVPLCIFKSLDAYEYLRDFILNKLYHIDLNTVGSKIFVYMPTVLSATGRFIAYSASAAYLGSEMGMGEELSTVMGVIIGGIAGSSVIGIAEHNSLKYLFEQQEHPLNWKQKVGAVICGLEGVLLTLPLVTTGMEAVKGWSPFIKGILFSPLFISHSIYEARSIYKAIELLLGNPHSHEDIVSLIPLGANNISIENYQEIDVELNGNNINDIDNNNL